MSDNVPETGDVVIHGSDSDATPSYVIYAVPGPDQFGCATRGEAERVARSYTRRAGLNLWLSEERGGFTLLARFRSEARRQRRRTPSIDLATGAVPNQRPTTAA